MTYKDRLITPNSTSVPKRDTTNLLKETVGFLNRFNYTLDDIVYAGNSIGTLFIPSENLLTSLDIDYDAGYGSVGIDESFIITLRDGTTLTRWNSSGCEGWRYNASSPKETAKELTTLKGTMS